MPESKFTKPEPKDGSWCTGLIFGDAISNIRDMADESINLVIADPPVSYSDEWMLEAKRVMKRGASMMLFQYGYGSPASRAARNLFRSQGSFVWTFDNPVHFERIPLCHSHILWFSKGRPKVRSQIQKSVLHIERPSTQFGIVEKPAELMRQLISSVTDSGDMVLDPFMGVGGAVTAALNSKRRVVGVECQKKLFVEAYNRVYPSKE